jgi:hypothetical protein
MSQAAVQRPPARFDASVATGGRPAPFPGFVEPCHPTLREEAPAGALWGAVASERIPFCRAPGGRGRPDARAHRRYGCDRRNRSATAKPMQIATYNVNGVNGRLPVLLRWLEQAQPDVVCLQELKAPQEKFPLADIRKAGFGAIWPLMVSRSLHAAPSPSRRGAGFPATPRTSTAAISRRLSAG